MYVTTCHAFCFKTYLWCSQLQNRCEASHDRFCTLQLCQRIVYSLYQLVHLMYFSISYQIASLLSSRELNQTYVYPNCLLVRCEIISSDWKTRILMKEIANSGFVKEPLELFGNCKSTFSNSLELDTWLL